MELNHLKYFYYVAREGGFSKASRTLRIAQPAITKTVKKLESDLGLRLFDRVGRNVQLTKVGNDIYRKCELIFLHVHEIGDIQRSRPKTIAGNLNIGAAEPIATHLLPEVVKKLLTAHPKIYPQIVTCTASELCRSVALGKLDFALLFHAPQLSDDLEIRSTFPVRFRLVIATAKKKNREVCASFIGSREVDNVANQQYPTLNKLRKKFPDAEIKISANALSAHRQMVLDGLGVSILPEFLVRDDLRSKKLSVLFDHPDFTFKLKVICRRGQALSIAAQASVDQFASNV